MPINVSKYQQQNYNELYKRINKVVFTVENIIKQSNIEAAGIALNLDYDGTVPFKFSDYPEVKKSVNSLKNYFAKSLEFAIVGSTRAEWELANEHQNELAIEILKSFGVDDPKSFAKYFRKNTEALNSFINRKTKGMSLSDRIWQLSGDYIEELEVCLSKGIERGTSAVTLSKRLSKYLKDFEKIKYDYTEMFGRAVKIADCEYRSIRLARTEINMAYRNADVLRWQQMDFVVGYEVKRSQREYPCDVCEALKGKYPKNFRFTSWHPNCLCFVVPVLCTDEEFWNDVKDSVNSVNDLPEGYKQWVVENKERIIEAKKRNTLPFFLKDNPASYTKLLKASKVK